MGLMVLNIGGLSRAVTVNDSCEHCRSFFAPAALVKVIAVAVTHEQWKQPLPHSLGERCIHFQMHDVESLRKGGRVAVIAVPAAAAVAVSSDGTRAGPSALWRLPTDLHPVQPPHRLI